MSNAHETSTEEDWPLSFGTGRSASSTISWTEHPSMWLKKIVLVNRQIKNTGNVSLHNNIIKKKEEKFTKV